MLIIGVKESSLLNSIITSANLAIVLLIIICGSIKLDFSNWTLLPYVKHNN
jgi:amino acid transporter